jgi:hypothetical protein
MFPVLWTIGATLLVVGLAWCGYWLWQNHGIGEWWIELILPGLGIAALGLVWLTLTAIARLIYWWATGG